MSIFMISPKDKDIPENNTPAIPEVSPEKKDVQEKGEVVENIGFLTQKEIDEKTIVLDGPLSQTYTQALNQAYAKESYITEIKTIGEMKNREDEEAIIDADVNYVYVTNKQALESIGFNEAFESVSLACETWKEVFVYVDHSFDISPKVADFLTYARNKGAKIVNTREQALKMLASGAKKKKK